MLQCVAACCSVLLCVARWCGVLPCGAVWCGVLLCVVVWCSVLQCVARHYSFICFDMYGCQDSCMLQCVAACCNLLQCVTACVAVCSKMRVLFAKIVRQSLTNSPSSANKFVSD